MSQEAAKSFVSMVKQDPALKAQVKALKGEEQQVLAEIVKLGAAKKLAFTADEVKAASGSVGGKLSKNELDKVAGGGCRVILLSVAVCSNE